MHCIDDNPSSSIPFLLMFAWIQEAMREIRIAKMIDIDLINFHANLNGMFYGEKRKVLLDNMIKSLREIVNYAQNNNVRVMLENVPLSNGIHNVCKSYTNNCDAKGNNRVSTIA
jgi:sugar phosphate isomerase/epimerase